MTKRLSPKWYIQEDHKIKGPYTPHEIQILLGEGKIQGKSLVSGGPKDNHSKTVNDLVKPLSDPVYSLFNALQFAQNITKSLSLELAKTPLKQYQPKTRMLLGMGFCLLLLLISAIIYLDRNGPENAHPFKPPSDSNSKSPASSEGNERSHFGNSGNPHSPASKLLEKTPESNPEQPQTETISPARDEPQVAPPEPDSPADQTDREPASVEEEKPIDPPPAPEPENPPEPLQPAVDPSE